MLVKPAFSLALLALLYVSSVVDVVKSSSQASQQPAVPATSIASSPATATHEEEFHMAGPSKEETLDQRRLRLQRERYVRSKEERRLARELPAYQVIIDERVERNRENARKYYNDHREEICRKKRRENFSPEVQQQLAKAARQRSLKYYQTNKESIAAKRRAERQEQGKVARRRNPRFHNFVEGSEPDGEVPEANHSRPSETLQLFKR